MRRGNAQETISSREPLAWELHQDRELLVSEDAKLNFQSGDK